MKKLLALALAIVMMMAIALPTFAAAAEKDPVYSERFGDGNDDSAADNYLVDANDKYTKPEVEVKYGVAQAYTAIIPEAISFHEFTAETTGNQTKGYVYSLQELVLEDVVLAADEFLNVYVASQKTTTYVSGTATTWCLVDVEDHKTEDGTGARVNYALRTDDFLGGANIAGIANGGALLSCKAAGGNNGTLGSSAKTNLYFSSKGTAQEGTYVDYLTFTVAVELTAVEAVNG